MKIVSKFKDYYDYISHIYGADPNCVYMRTKIPWSTLNKIEAKDIPQIRNPLNDSKRSGQYYIALLVVGNIVEPLLCSVGKDDTEDGVTFSYGTHKYEVLDPVKHSHLLEKTGRWDYLNEIKDIGGYQFPILPKIEKVNALTKKLGHPVYMTHPYERQVCVYENIPILKDIEGFSGKYKPEVVWQSIYSTIQDVIRTNPDKLPPVEVANEFKIHAAGFDLKTSFRNPINKKPKKNK